MGEGGAEPNLFTLRAAFARRKIRGLPHASTGLSRRPGSPLRSARWPASASVEMTDFSMRSLFRAFSQNLMRGSRV